MLTGERFVFIHLPRTGGKSITKMLARHGQETIEGQTSRHATAREARALLGTAAWAERMHFAVVRNPWDRLLSLYTFHAQTPAQLLASTGQKASRGFLAAHQAFTELGDFDAFLRWYAEGPSGHDDVQRHRFDQLTYLMDADGTLLIERICRYESLLADMKGVLADLSISGQLPWINGHLRPHYSRYYSAIGRDLVAQSCAKEIAHFGYRYA